MDNDPHALPVEPPLLVGLDQRDRVRLRETLLRLLHHTAIIRDDPGCVEIYDWANLHRAWVREVAALIGYDVVFEEPFRLILCVPQEEGIIRRFTIEESCIAMVLWHDYDTALREGATRVCVTVKNLNDSFAAKLKGVKLPTRAGMKASLQLFHRHRLIRLSASEDFADSTIEILHTLRLVMPFQQLDEWQRQAQSYVKTAPQAANGAVSEEEEGDEPA
ncbi:MAG TPA: DUF4194 domain-containing protein [Pyrinomonadaceae bacterium]|nr:DUF4194 domain-containing protein [Pyrinomonadaceae bacterium]